MADKVDFSDDMPIVKVIHDDCCIQDRAVHLLMCLSQQPTGSFAFLHNDNDVQRSDLADVIDPSIVLALHVSVRLLLKQIPMVKRSSLVSGDPGVEVLEEVDICLDVLTERSR